MVGWGDGAAGQPPDVWLSVQESPHLEFMSNITSKQSGAKKDGGGGMTTITTTFHLRSQAPGADKVVAEFIAAAYDRYIQAMKNSEDKGGRYMYTPLPKSDGHWKRYKLSDEKTFGTLFFPQKDQ